MKTEEIRNLIKMVEDAEIDELEISRWGQRVRITKHKNHTQNSQQPQHITVTSPQPQSHSTPASRTATEPQSGNSTAAEPVSESAGEEETGKKYEEVKSPIVGTFYRSPSPDDDPYVEVGDRVTPGQTLCIIEAMKIMNEIESEHAGVIQEILIDDAQPVEYNQTLFHIEPV